MVRKSKTLRFLLGALAVLVAFLVSFGLRSARDRSAREEHAVVRRSRAPVHVEPPPRGGSLTGVVTTHQGALRGVARVCATAASVGLTRLDDEVCTDSEDGGRYVLRGLGRVGYQITASAASYGIGSADHGRPLFATAERAREDLDIVLPAGGHEVAGQVLDATGGPIAAALVRLVSWGEPIVSTTVTTDDEGRFVASVDGEHVTAIARAHGYGSARAYRATPTRDLTLVLTPESRLLGQVLTIDEELPVAGARVSAMRLSSMGAPTREVITGEDGRFVLDGIDPGRYLVTATAPGMRGRAEDATEVEVGGSASNLRVLMVTERQVHGRVLVQGGPSETPCAEGTVMLGPPHPSLSLRAGATWTEQALQAQPKPPATLIAPIGADGAVHFDAVPAGAYFATVACFDHVQHGGPDLVKVGDTDVADLLWQVTRGTRLTVRVVDESNRPVPGARVRLRWPRSGSLGGMSTTLSADAKGVTYPLSDLPPGTFTVSAVDGYQADPIEIVLTPGAKDATGTLRLRGSGAIEVQVQDHAGRPVDDVRVSARPCEPSTATSESDRPRSPPRDAHAGIARGRGRARIGPLPAGCYRVEAGDYVHPHVSARGDGVQLASGQAAQLTLTLERGARISGEVRAEDGRPVRDAWVSAVESGADVDAMDLSMARLRIQAESRVLTDEDGRFTLERLDRSRSYDLTVEQPNGASTLQRGVRAGDAVRVRMPRPGQLEGEVLGAGGEAIQDFTLRVVEASTQRTEIRELVQAGGRFSLSGITPGQLEIQAIEPSGRVAALHTELKSGQRLGGLRLAMPP